MENPVHRHVREVAFADTDASGWVHFPNVFRFVEAAEHEFLRSRGITVFDPANGGWPRVHASCDYHRPIKPGESIEIQLGIATLGNSSIHWTFEVLGTDGTLKASGGMTTIRIGADGKKQSISPADRAALES